MPSFEITSIGTVVNDRTDIQHTDNWGGVTQPEWLTELMSNCFKP